MHHNHLKYMLLGGGGIAAVLLAIGVRPGQALLTAAVLACPLMIVGMMLFMGRNGSGHARSGNGRSGNDRSADEHAQADVPSQSNSTRNNS